MYIINDYIFILCDGNLYFGLIESLIKLTSYDENKKTSFDKNITMFQEGFLIKSLK